MLCQVASQSESRWGDACADRDQQTLTVGDHVGVEDEVVEEGQHLDHLVLCLCVGQLACTERLWDVGLEEVRVDGVHDLQGDEWWRAHVEQVLAVDGLLGLVVREVVSDASVFESKHVDTTGAELDEVGHVHLLDVTVEDELQVGVSGCQVAKH